jgi:hypothetical protein
MLQLRALKQQQQQQQQAASTLAEKKPENAVASTEGQQAPFVLKKQNSKELQEIRKQKSKENVLALRKKEGGKGKGGRKPNAAELRAQKDVAGVSALFHSI